MSLIDVTIAQDLRHVILTVHDLDTGQLVNVFEVDGTLPGDQSHRTIDAYAGSFIIWAALWIWAAHKTRISISSCLSDD